MTSCGFPALDIVSTSVITGVDPEKIAEAITEARHTPSPPSESDDPDLFEQRIDEIEAMVGQYMALVRANNLPELFVNPDSIKTTLIPRVSDITLNRQQYQGPFKELSAYIIRVADQTAQLFQILVATRDLETYLLSLTKDPRSIARIEPGKIELAHRCITQLNWIHWLLPTTAEQVQGCVLPQLHYIHNFCRNETKFRMQIIENELGIQVFGGEYDKEILAFLWESKQRLGQSKEGKIFQQHIWVYPA